MRIALSIALTLVLSSCATRGNMSVFDLGLAPAPDSATVLDVSIADVESPQWLDSTDMLYRLAWRDRHSLQPYAESRWAGPPAAMLTLRLRQAFDTATEHSTRSRCVLRVRLDEFSQVFSSETSSRAILQVQATLGIRGEPERALSRSWHIEQRAEAANASSGAAALAGATRELTQSLRSWVQLYCAM
jgi:cholesterol transport system auxiliary component